MAEEETNARTPPYSAESERGLIGSILLDVESGADAQLLDVCLAKGITPESFYEPRNRLIFTALTEMSRATTPIAAATLVDHLRSGGLLEAAGGAAAISAIVESTPTAAHAEYHLDVVRRNALLRKIVAKARIVERKCFEPHADKEADVLLGEVEKEFLEIGGDAGERVTWKNAVEKTFHALDLLFDSGSGTVDGLSTGYRDLDNALMGLKPGDMIVLAARPSMGKTSLAMNIAECVATGTDIAGNALRGSRDEPPGKQHPVLIFSLEMSTEALARRMLCGRARINAWRLQRGIENKAERAAETSRLLAARSELGKAPLYVDDTSALDVMDMRARARRMKRQHGIELIVIDYLQLANCREFAHQGRQLETSRISNQIKAMAKELQVPVIVLSQLSRANEQRGEKEEEPKMSDLRDSGAIEQDADVILLLRRPCRTRASKWKNSKKLAIVNVAKFRNGQTGEVDFNFEGDYTRFLNRRQGLTARETDDGELAGGAAAEDAGAPAADAGAAGGADPAAEAVAAADMSYA